MSAKEIGLTFRLDPERIDSASETIAEFLSGLELDHKEVLRLRFTAEEILLSWQEKFGAGIDAQLACYSRFGQPIIRLRLEGEPFNPLEKSEENGSEIGQSLMARLETTPIYGYSHGVNSVTFKILPKQKKAFLAFLIAMVLAAIVGFVGTFLPEGFRTEMANNLIGPVCDTYLNLLSLCGIPLIFLNIVLAITGIGDVNIFERISKKMALHFGAVLTMTVLLTFFVALPFFRFTFGEGGVSFAYTDLITMIFGWIPTGIFQAFVDLNTMQIIFLGIIFGIGLLKLDPLAKNLLHVLEDLDSFLLMVSEWAGRLIPAFTFLVIVKSFWLGQINAFLPMGKSWVITIGLLFVVHFLLVLQISLKHKASIGKLIHKVTKTFLIAFGTNSCAASVSENFNGCVKLGIGNKVLSLGVPIGTCVFKLGTAVRLIVLGFTMASMYGVPVSSTWFVVLLLMAFLLSISIPGIPGGVLIFAPMFFAQLGIPEEALVPMIATDIFFDLFVTAFNQICVPFALVQQSHKMDMLDEEALRR